VTPFHFAALRRVFFWYDNACGLGREVKTDKESTKPSLKLEITNTIPKEVIGTQAVAVEARV
jgi:hypothetical protein